MARTGVRVSDLPPELQERARQLKREAAEQERQQMVAYFTGAGLPRPLTEHAFAAEAVGRGWRFDLAWPDARVALEIEGGVFGRGKPCEACGQRKGGAHSSVTGLKRDIEKYNAAAVLGWRIIRVVPDDVYAGPTIALLRQAMNLPTTRNR